MLGECVSDFEMIINYNKSKNFSSGKGKPNSNLLILITCHVARGWHMQRVHLSHRTKYAPLSATKTKYRMEKENYALSGKKFCSEKI